MNIDSKRCAAILAALGLCGDALAVSGETVRAMPPAERAGFEHAIQGLAHRSVRAPGSLDTTPPVLTGFAMKVPRDFAAPLAQFEADVTATDDLSGVASFEVDLVGPSGQTVFVPGYNSVPGRKFSQRAARDVTPYMEPGTWTVSYLFLFDLAQNYAVYDTDALSKLGATQFQIANGKSKDVDLDLPILVSGKVVTPTVSLSGFAKGTNLPEIAAADFVATDAGSGIVEIYGYWCLADQSSCIGTNVSPFPRGMTKATGHTGGPVYPGTPPGEYLLYSLDFYDWAGNQVYLTGSDFGSGVDFSQYMPAGHSITVTP